MNASTSRMRNLLLMSQLFLVRVGLVVIIIRFDNGFRLGLLGWTALLDHVGDRRSRESHLGIGVDLDDYRVVLDCLDGAPDATDGNHLVALLQRFEHLLRLFLLLVLRTNNEKVEDDKDESKGDERRNNGRRTCRRICTWCRHHRRQVSK